MMYGKMLMIVVSVSLSMVYANIPCSNFSVCSFSECVNMFEIKGSEDTVGCTGVDMRLAVNNISLGKTGHNYSYSQQCSISNGFCMYSKFSGPERGLHRCCYITSCAVGQYRPICNCVNCPAGSYCLGSIKVTAPCSIGTYSTSGQSVCTSCSGNSYSIFNQSSCVTCDRGMYAPMNGNTVCLSCPTNKSQLVYLVSVGHKMCDCSVGMFYNGTHCVNCSSLCVRGFYESRECNISSDRICTQCPSGSYSFSGNQTSCSSCPLRKCLNCPSGCPDGMFKRDGMCINCSKSCPVGQYRSRPCVGWRDIRCSDCPLNHVCNESSFIPCPNASCRKCINCNIGAYSLANATSCSTCAVGKFASAVGLSICGNCVPGTYSNVTITSTACLNCTVGSFCINATRQPCKQGSFSGQYGASVCTLCPAGKYNVLEEGNSSNYCVVCPINHFCELGTSSPKICPVGMYGNEVGLSTCTYCTNKPEKSYYTNNICNYMCITGFKGTYCDMFDARSCSSRYDCQPYSECRAEYGWGCNGIDYLSLPSGNGWGAYKINGFRTGYCLVEYPGWTEKLYYAPSYNYCYNQCDVTCSPGQYVLDCKCTACPSGFTCSGILQPFKGGAEIDGSCGNGTYSKEGSTSCLNCTVSKKCEIGYLLAECNSTHDKMCLPCPANSYCPDVGVVIQCPLYLPVSPEGSTSLKNCTCYKPTLAYFTNFSTCTWRCNNDRQGTQCEFARDFMMCAKVSDCDYYSCNEGILYTVPSLGYRIDIWGCNKIANQGWNGDFYTMNIGDRPEGVCLQRRGYETYALCPFSCRTNCPANQYLDNCNCYQCPSVCMPFQYKDTCLCRECTICNSNQILVRDTCNNTHDRLCRYCAYGEKVVNNTCVQCDDGFYLFNNSCVRCPTDSYCVNNSRILCPGSRTSLGGAFNFADCQCRVPANALVWDDLYCNFTCSRAYSGSNCDSFIIQRCNIDADCAYCAGNCVGDPRIYCQQRIGAEYCAPPCITSCPAGQYLYSCDACFPCKTGTYCSGGAAQAVDCPAGSYCLFQASAPTPCGNGSYNNATRSTTCYACDAGVYCPLRATAPIVCPAGGYCPFRSMAPVSCAPGTYSTSVGATSSAVCIQCAGRQSEFFATQNCTNVTNALYAACKAPCASDEYMPVNCTEFTNRTCVRCTQCGVGQYEARPCTATLNRICLNCPSEAYCPDMSKIYNCTKCADGYYQTQACTNTTNRVCSLCDGPCQADFYESVSCTNVTNRKCTRCSLCGNETYYTGPCTAYADTVCTPCTTCGDFGEVTPCSAKFNRRCNYQPCTKYSDCTYSSCLAQKVASWAYVGCTCVDKGIQGLYMVDKSLCRPDLFPGSVCIAQGYNVDVACPTNCPTSCPTSQYKTYCECANYSAPCLPGAYESTKPNATTDRVCSPCQQGFYCNGTHSMPCTRCAVGLYKTSECNATTNQQCQLCPSETYCFNDTIHPCSPVCNPDTEALLVECSPKTDRICCSTVLCDMGQYQSRACTNTTRKTCSDCPSYAYCPGDDLKYNCSLCEPGYYSSEYCTPVADRQCNLCPFGYLCNDGINVKECSVCASGKFRTKECTIAVDTECTNCSLCEPGFYAGDECTPYTDAVCYDCPVGYLCNDGVNVKGCSECVNGTYKTQQCTTSVDTVCRNCTYKPSNSFYVGPGTTAMNCPWACNVGFSKAAVLCSSCTNKPANAVYTTSGSTTTTCQWECNSGFNRTATSCVIPTTTAPPTTTPVPCRESCSPGQLEQAPCTTTSDRVCGPCPTHYFCPNASIAVPCTLPCMGIELRPCTSIQDRLCRNFTVENGTKQDTTLPPDTTTSAPETITSAPETITSAPKTTTSAPETTTSAPKTTTSAPETTTATPPTTSSPPPPPEPVPLQADLVISEAPVVVCLNLDYFVQSFCNDVRTDNDGILLNCSAKSLNGVDCPDGVCPCDTFTATRRRLLQATANLSTLVVYEVIVVANLSQPVEVFRPVIRPTQPWILAVMVTEIPRSLVAAASSSPIAIIAGAVAGVVVIGAIVGVAVWLLLPRAPYTPIPTAQPTLKRKLPTIFIELKSR